MKTIRRYKFASLRISKIGNIYNTKFEEYLKQLEPI